MKRVFILVLLAGPILSAQEKGLLGSRWSPGNSGQLPTLTLIDPSMNLFEVVGSKSPCFFQGDEFYTCHARIWYVAENHDGPWALARRLPASLERCEPVAKHLPVGPTPPMERTARFHLDPTYTARDGTVVLLDGRLWSALYLRTSIHTAVVSVCGPEVWTHAVDDVLSAGGFRYHLVMLDQRPHLRPLLRPQKNRFLRPPNVDGWIYNQDVEGAVVVDGRVFFVRNRSWFTPHGTSQEPPEPATTDSVLQGGSDEDVREGLRRARHARAQDADRRGRQASPRPTRK